ncbi:SPRY domain-containing SOCS box protein 3-like isoform X1 [Vespula maculifrons]|uniref:SPRY domain-containing SOCS box protein 3-like isoform X1 n=1 Tax=Vespula maculifrons TaxID=7453 RepID=A0ABD2ASI1_VESMC
MNPDTNSKNRKEKIRKKYREWSWDAKCISGMCELSKNNLEVTFNPKFSKGTAAARGNKPLKLGRHHYWELRIITIAYGTDVMIGVGTKRANLMDTEGKFCSLLGQDYESWGYSYKGYLQHGGQKHPYTACFNEGSVIGVHLDTWRGRLQFFSKQKSLGVAFTGLKNIVLYPMISSTSANTKIRILYCCSIPSSLQTECLSVLPRVQRNFLSDTYPVLQYLTQSTFADVLRKNSEIESDEEVSEFAPKYRRSVKLWYRRIN